VTGDGFGCITTRISIGQLVCVSRLHSTDHRHTRLVLSVTTHGDGAGAVPGLTYYLVGDHPLPDSSCGRWLQVSSSRSLLISVCQSPLSLSVHDRLRSSVKLNFSTQLLLRVGPLFGAQDQILNLL
jgi:hypothetical protein